MAGSATVTTLASFPGINSFANTDPERPQGGLVRDSSENLFGLTTGGRFALGTVFESTQNGAASASLTAGTPIGHIVVGTAPAGATGLALSVVRSTVPSSLVAGTKLKRSAGVEIDNATGAAVSGNVNATGALVLTLSPSSEGASAIPGVRFSTHRRRVTIKPARSGKYVLSVKVPTGLIAGAYFPFVAVTLDGVSATAVEASSFTIE